MASSPLSTATPPSLNNTSKKPESALTSSTVPSNSKKPRYATSVLEGGMLTCRPPMNAIADVLPPEQAAELLPWYMQWSRDLAAEMHQRRLVRDKARRTNRPPISNRPCDCASEWRCEPHGACFIHDSCFCPGSGSFPPVKPPRS